ncbi:ABC transporter permease [Candidatus Woesearchaeota archaeon]|nr:ABC transporter permease [Candidatus Woesearchaeota archaeon]
MIIDLFLYSFRNLKNRRLRTWLTMIGIVIGIASVIALVGLGGGLKAAITGQFTGVSADILTIQAGGVAFSGPPGSGVVNPLKKDYVDDIEKISYVDFAAGRLIEAVKMDYNNIQDIAVTATIPGGKVRTEFEKIFDLKLEQGRLLKDEDTSKVLLGHNFLKKDNGFDKEIVAGSKIELNGKGYEVVGILKAKGSFMFDSVIFFNDQPLRDIVNNKDNVDLIVARVKNINDIDKAKEAIEKYLRNKRDVKEGEEDFRVQSAQSTIDTINGVLGGVQAFVIIIAAISMIVGAIGIINTMFTAVLERRKEIGIMKSIGAKNEDIFLLFLIESGLLGFVGGLIGVIIGWLLAILGTNALSAALGLEASPDISFAFALFALLASFFIGAASGVIPAMQAASMKPVDALRG